MDIFNKLEKELGGNHSKGNVKLNLGCGVALLKGYLNTDKFKPYDKYLDLDVIPYPFKSNVFDRVVLISALEHTNNPTEILTECHRILKPKGLLIINVPFYNSLNAFRCTTHKTYYTMNSFDGFDIDFKADIRDNEERDKPKFKIKKYLRGTFIGKLIPNRVRNFVALHIGNIGESIQLIMMKEK